MNFAHYVGSKKNVRKLMRTDCNLVRNKKCLLNSSVTTCLPLTGVDFGVSNPKVLFIGSSLAEGKKLEIGGNDNFGFITEYAGKEKFDFNKDSAYVNIIRCCMPTGIPVDLKKKTLKACGKEHLERIIESTGANLIIICGPDAASFFPNYISSESKANKLTKSYRSIVPDRIYYYIESPNVIVEAAEKGEWNLFEEFQYTLRSAKMQMELGIARKIVDYTLVDTLEKAEYFYNILKSKDVLTCDIETATLDRFSPLAKTITISFSWEEQQGVCFPLDHPETPFFGDSLDLIKELIRDILLDDKIAKIFANGKFDVPYLEKTINVRTTNFFFDTMLAHYTIDETKGTHSLKRLAMMYTDMGDYDSALELYKDNNNIVSYSEIPLELLWVYNCCDTDATIRIFNILKVELESAEKGYERFQHLMNLSDTLSEIEENGFALNRDLLAKLEIEMPIQLKVLENKFFSYPEVIKTQQALTIKANEAYYIKHPKGRKKISVDFNPDSPIHLRTLLFDSLRLHEVLPMAQLKEYLTKKGQEDLDMNEIDEIGDVPLQFLSTGAGSLEFLSKMKAHEVVDILLEYRGLSKLYGTYVKPVRTEWISPDGLVHSNNKVHGTATGRLASEKPNMQNIPRGSVIKQMFTSRWEGGLFGQLDYSQIELKVAAMLSQDPFLTAAFRSGEDIHKKTASLIFHKDTSEVTKDERQYAKSINFGVIYGKMAWSLSTELGISFEEAEEFIRLYFEAYPGLKDWLEMNKRKIIDEERSVSMFGRVRHFPGIKALHRINKRSKDQSKKYYGSLREGGNHIIQSTAADFTLHSIVLLQKYLKQSGLKSLILGTVYDSIMVDIYPGEVRDVIETFKAVMENIGELIGLDWITLPITADAEVGPNWGSLSKVGSSDKNYAYLDKDVIRKERERLISLGKDPLVEMKDKLYDLRDNRFYTFNPESEVYEVC
jgi:DNA polymerase-1